MVLPPGDSNRNLINLIRPSARLTSQPTIIFRAVRRRQAWAYIDEGLHIYAVAADLYDKSHSRTGAEECIRYASMPEQHLAGAFMYRLRYVYGL
jgi:hypothetical protein